MRIARLDLAAYGKFTNRSFDFGSPAPGAPDFHVVYGLNETGKSTFAAAVLDLFYGIETQTRYAFLHPYGAMRVGARLDLSGGALEVLRVKKANGLLDADGKPLAEETLRAELHGVERLAYRTMFSLDDESLEQGGKSILESKGDLGELLFTGSAGLGELSGRLVGLRERADHFYKYRARNSELAEFKARLDGLRKRRESIDTLASAYADLAAKRVEAAGAYEAAERERARSRSRLEEIQRISGALPNLATLRETEGQLAALADLPEPPRDWRDDLNALQGEDIKLRTQLETCDAALVRLQDELQGVEIDDAALAAAADVEAWEEPRSRFIAAKDILTRREELASVGAKIAGLLHRLGREEASDPSGLMLKAATSRLLRELSQARSGIENTRENARALVVEAKTALDDILAKLPEHVGGEALEMAVLAARVEALRKDDFRQRLRANGGATIQLASRLHEALAKLRPWSGDDEALARLSLPSEGEIARLREGEAAAQKTYETEAREAARLEDEAASLSAEIAALNKSADLVSDAEAIEIRAARDAAWARHRAELEAASADAFEQAMRRDDWSSRSRLAASADVANLRGLQQRLARCESLLNTGSARLAACEAALAARRQEIAAALPVAAPPGRDPLSFFEAWRELRSKALEARALYDEAKRALGEAQADETRARNDLLEALSAAGAPGDSAASFEAIFANAEAIVERERNHAASRAQAGERRRDLERAEKKLSTAMIADEAWQAAWRAACAQTWLGENGAMPTLGAVADALEALQDLRPLVAQRDDLMHRIATMERDRANFAHEVARCGTALGMGAGGDDVVRHSKAIEERVMRARENTRRRAEKVNALEVERASRAKVREALAINGGRTAEMTRYFGVEGLTEVAQKLDACARRDELRERRDRAAGDIVTAFQAASFAEIRLLLEAADRTALEAERTDLKANEAIEDRRVADAYASHSEIDARLRAIGGDDEVARIEEERRTILEEIKDKALSYLRTKAGVAAADGALRLYRDQHRGAMMARASDAFALISRGAYSGLTTQPNGAGETLIALAAGGGSKEVDQLSKGARFQLYLALRVAGYHEFAKTRAPAPFMADDIMETFDHFRAEEALRLFADMSRVGQVIYFTHHQHLSEIAQQVCPQARVHQLSG